MVGVVRRGGKRPWYSCTSHSPCNDRPTTERKKMASTFSMRKESAWDKAREHNSFWKILDTNHTWETHYLHRMLAVCWESCVHFISQQGVEMSRIEGILFTLASAPTVIRLKGDDLRMEWWWRLGTNPKHCKYCHPWLNGPWQRHKIQVTKVKIHGKSGGYLEVKGSLRGPDRIT